MLAYAKTDIGLVRKTNEDSYVFLPPGLFAVADGMGGHEAGEIASSLAVSTVSEYVKKITVSIEPNQLLNQAISQANQIIFQMSQCRPECSGMGTTVTAVCIQGSTVYWGHVGDSRLYLLRDGQIQQLTSDHSLVGELLLSGSITPEEAHVHPHRNILTRAVGTSENIQVDCGSSEWGPGDQLLLCTDGLTSMVTDTEIQEIISEKTEIAGSVDQLISRANTAGGFDNITVILLQYGD